MSIFELLEEAYAQARTLSNEREAAFEAGKRLEETVRTQSQTIIDLTRQRNKYKGTMAEQDGTIAAQRLALEDAHNTIANMQQEIDALRAQVANMGQRLDANRQNNRARQQAGTACGSVVIGSTYDKDTNPRD